MQLSSANTTEFQTFNEKLITSKDIGDDLEQLTGKNNLEDVFFLTDMDQTMYVQDIGIVVYLQKLITKEYWETPLDEFAEVLLPKKYRQLIRRLSLHDPLASKIWVLYEDILNLYKYKVGINGLNHLDVDQEFIKTFAFKMLVFDELMFDTEKLIQEHYNDELIMRIRLSHGHAISKVLGLTAKAMAVQPEDEDAEIKLSLDWNTMNDPEAEQAFLNNDEEFKPRSIDRVVSIFDGTYAAIQSLIERGSVGRVVTTNLRGLANEAINNSVWGELLATMPNIKQSKHGNRFSIGTDLEEIKVDRVENPKARKTMLSTFKTKPIFGPEKVKEGRRTLIDAQQILNRPNLKIMAGFGDSPSNDWPFIKRVIENGGYGFLIGNNHESITKRFGSKIEAAIRTGDITESAKSRIICITKEMGTSIANPSRLYSNKQYIS